jgi:hypothetical protein
MGAPLGNQNARKGKVWTQAIERALEKRSAKGRMEALDDLAEQLLLKAETGDMAALRELGDRLEGKPKEQVELSGPDGGPIEARSLPSLDFDAIRDKALQSLRDQQAAG